MKKVILAVLLLTIVLTGCNMFDKTAKTDEQRTTQFNICEQIAMVDGMKMYADSGRGWDFTLNEDVVITEFNESLGTLSKTYYGIDISQYYGKPINVHTYDALPANASSGVGNWTTYVFIFTGNDLIFQRRLENAEEFEAIKTVCNQLAANGGNVWPS